MNDEGKRPEDAWEAICNRCGRCCFEKWIEGDGRIRHTIVPCRFLDIATRECRVYHKRLEVDEGCIQLTPEIVRNVCWLPEECAYTELVKGEKERARQVRREE